MPSCHLPPSVTSALSPRQRVNVLTVEGGDEGRVQPLDDFVGDPVALMLGRDDIGRQVAHVRPLVHHAVEQPGRVDAVFACLDEEVEEGLIAGK